MKKTLIQFLLLSSLFFNIAHATIIAIEDDCHKETVHAYVMEQSKSSECAKVCDIHHCFHCMAILFSPSIDFESNRYKTNPAYKTSLQPQVIHKRNIKPPIV